MDAIIYRANHEASINIRDAASLAVFKNCIKTWKYKDCQCRSCKIFIPNVGYI